ncbi:MAG: sugar phosphate isomerase/epimerase [Lentisphaeria bacterium]|nr:sugar phosphate isomerase/epimerase [Lentisphaeria bacterium]
MKIGVIPQRFKEDVMTSLRTAKRIGAETVQLYAVANGENLHDFSDTQLNDIKNYCTDNNLEITGICGEVGGFGFRLPEKNADRIDFTYRNMLLAKKLGGYMVSSHIGVINPQVRALQLESLRKIAEYAEELQIYFAIETGPEPSAILLDLVNEVNSDYVKINLDPANLVMVQNEDAVSALKNFGNTIVHTHAKDGINYHECASEEIYTAFAHGGIKELFAKNGKAFAETPIGHGAIDWTVYMTELHKLNPELPMIIEREISSAIISECEEAINYLKSIREFIS